MFLNVHEKPMTIGAYCPHNDDQGLVEGMVISNEPGFYEQDQFGIRIESLISIKKAETRYNFKDREFLCFETISLVPIQTKLLKLSLLSSDEILWINEYHKKCLDIVGKALEEQEKTEALKWLIKETEPIGC